MAAFNAYKTFQGWIITATIESKTRYLQSFRNGEYKFHRDSLYARPVTAATASKYLSDLTGLPFKVNDRTDGLQAKIVREMIKKGWDNDEALLIADRIFRQYESNVMGMSIQMMIKRQPTKEEWRKTWEF